MIINRLFWHENSQSEPRGSSGTMDCGSSCFKFVLAYLIVSLLIILYKYQNVFEVSFEIHPSQSIGAPSFDERNQYAERILSDDEDVRSGGITDRSFAQDEVDTKIEEIKDEEDGSESISARATSHPEIKQTVKHNSSISVDPSLFNATEIEIDQNFIFVDPPGDFLDRIQAYNDAITKLRHSIQIRRNYKPWQGLSEPLDVLWCNRDDFMEVLKNYTHVTSIQLKWHDSGERSSWSSLKDQGNILIKQYYQWSASETLCKWIETPGYTNARWDAVYNRTCSQNMSVSSVVASIEPLYFHGKPINIRDYWPNEGLSYPDYFYTDYPDYLIYIHVIEDAIILRTGDIISKNLKLVPYACSQDTNPRPPLGYEDSPIYSEVFLVSQFWGGEFFHSMIEGFPRVAPYLRFLQDNPSVLVHVVEPKMYIRNTLRFLGVNPERLISGIVRAKVVYVPQATPCGFSQIHGLQILNYLYLSKLQGGDSYGKEKQYRPRAGNGDGNNNDNKDDDLIKLRSEEHDQNTENDISNNDNNEKDTNKDTKGNDHPQNGENKSTVIFIRRSGLRKFRQNREIEQTVETAASDFQLPFLVFRDDPSPTMEEAMAMFSAADLVVAPHGAGLSNLVYARPGTYVIEGVCNEPHSNMCYQWMSHILGHRYHAIPSRRGCEDFIDIEPAIIDIAVRTYLQEITHNKLSDTN